MSCSKEHDFKDQAPFVLTYETTTPGQEILIPTNSDFDYLYFVEWGDGKESINLKGDARHSFKTPGTYRVSIYGRFPSLGIKDHYRVPENYSAGYSGALRSVESWGDISWRSFRNAFNHVRNLTFNTSEVPDLSLTKDLAYVFRGAVNFDSDISNWDVSQVEDMEGMFAGATTFNRDISGWDVAQVENMAHLFRDASSFNQDISGWNVSSVTRMDHMFIQADNFNHDLGQWDVSNVTNMTNMFSSAFSFNQDIGDWDVSRVTLMGGMFVQAYLFNQDIGQWDVSNVTDMGSMFGNAKAFDQDLSNWNTINVVHCISFATGSGLGPEDLPTTGSCRF